MKNLHIKAVTVFGHTYYYVACVTNNGWTKRVSLNYKHQYKAVAAMATLQSNLI